jgi:lysophospholipase
MTLASMPDNPAPPGTIVGGIRAADGVRLRTARWLPSLAARGTVAIFGGRGEFIEKYFEVVGELLSRGFAAVVMDWRGQGRSERLLRDPRKGHVDDFSHFGRDLVALVSAVLEPHCPHPWYGLGHSMGAAVLLSEAEAGSCPFERLVLTSPMIAVKGVDHHGVTLFVIWALDALGLGGAYAPSASARSVWSDPFAGNVLTSDPIRYARTAKLIESSPELRLGGPTVGWTHAAFRLFGRFEDPNFPRGTVTPILIVAAGGDRVTDTASTELFATRLRAGRIVVIDGAEHEIMIERDFIRAQFWSAFDQFVPGSEAPCADRHED